MELPISNLSDFNGLDITEKYFILNGYKILEKDFRNKIGTIDIVAQKDNVLTFISVEVKSKFRQERTSITFTEQQKIRRTAQYYLLNKDLLSNIPMLSFDKFEIITYKNKIVRLNHIPRYF